MMIIFSLTYLKPFLLVLFKLDQTNQWYIIFLHCEKELVKLNNNIYIKTCKLSSFYILLFAENP